MRIGLAMAAGAALLAACSAADEEPAPVPEETFAEPSVAVDATAEIEQFLLQEYPDAGAIRYALAWSDLDGDGADEAIVHLVGPYFCGTGGCTTLVLTPAGPMLRKVGDISVSRTPVTVLDTSTNGWKDLTVAIAGGGGPSGNAWLRFDGEAYPANPTVAPAELAATTGAVLLGDEPDLLEAAPATRSGG